MTLQSVFFVLDMNVRLLLRALNLEQMLSDLSTCSSRIFKKASLTTHAVLCKSFRHPVVCSTFVVGVYLIGQAVGVARIPRFLISTLGRFTVCIARPVHVYQVKFHFLVRNRYYHQRTLETIFQNIKLLT